jgi:hypothetical protein
MEMTDVTGTPRPVRDIEAALRFVEAEMVKNPTRMGPNDTGPALIHYSVVRDVLRAEVARRTTTAALVAAVGPTGSTGATGATGSEAACTCPGRDEDDEGRDGAKRLGPNHSRVCPRWRAKYEKPKGGVPIGAVAQPVGEARSLPAFAEPAPGAVGPRGVPDPTGVVGPDLGPYEAAYKLLILAEASWPPSETMGSHALQVGSDGRFYLVIACADWEHIEFALDSSDPDVFIAHVDGIRKKVREGRLAAEKG